MASCGKTEHEIRSELNKSYTDYYYNQIHSRDSLISNKDSIINSFAQPRKPIYYWYENHNPYGQKCIATTTDSSLKIGDTVYCGASFGEKVAIITSIPHRLK